MHRHTNAPPPMAAGPDVRGPLPAERQVQRRVPGLRRREGVLPGQRVRGGVRAAVRLAQPARAGCVRCCGGTNARHCLRVCWQPGPELRCQLRPHPGAKRRIPCTHACTVPLLAVAQTAALPRACERAVVTGSGRCDSRRMRRHLPAGRAGEGGRGPQHQAHRRVQERGWGALRPAAHAPARPPMSVMQCMAGPSPAGPHWPAQPCSHERTVCARLSSAAPAGPIRVQAKPCTPGRAGWSRASPESVRAHVLPAAQATSCCART